ncbi:MAG: hypothetical protein OYG32_04895 [Rhodospirillaceae bacterium]|nr:hypothetical protein [Rhodospirillaceae bacterium]
MDDGLGSRGIAHRRTAAALIAAALAGIGAAAAQQPPAGADSRYGEAAESILPVSPALIMDFNERLRAARGAASWRPPPRSVSVDADLASLDPGATPPEVRLAPGVATVVTFSDATGGPWPVAGFVVGDASAFDIRHPGGIDGEQGPSHLTMAPLVEAGWSNLVVELAGAAIPLVLSLGIDPLAPHYRLDIQVLAEGPNARPAREAGSPPPRAGSAWLLRFVAAVDLPAGATELAVPGVGRTRAWLIGGRGEGDGGEETIVVRTEHHLLGPAWSEAMAGTGGLRVYRLPAVDALLFSVDGAATVARLRRP